MMIALEWTDHGEIAGEMARDLAAMTSRILAMQSSLAAALKREDNLVGWLVRFLDIAEPAESMAHLDEIEAMNLLVDELKEALEPYRVKSGADA